MLTSQVHIFYQQMLILSNLIYNNIFLFPEPIFSFYGEDTKGICVDLSSYATDNTFSIKILRTIMIFDQPNCDYLNSDYGVLLAGEYPRLRGVYIDVITGFANVPTIEVLQYIVSFQYLE